MLAMKMQLRLHMCCVHRAHRIQNACIHRSFISFIRHNAINIYSFEVDNIQKLIARLKICIVRTQTFDRVRRSPSEIENEIVAELQAYYFDSSVARATIPGTYGARSTLAKYTYFRMHFDLVLFSINSILFSHILTVFVCASVFESYRPQLIFSYLIIAYLRQ